MGIKFVLKVRRLIIKAAFLCKGIRYYFGLKNLNFIFVLCFKKKYIKILLNKININEKN